MSNPNKEQINDEELMNGNERMEWTVAAEHKKNELTNILRKPWITYLAPKFNCGSETEWLR